MMELLCIDPLLWFTQPTVQCDDGSECNMCVYGGCGWKRAKVLREAKKKTKNCDH